MDDIPIVQSSNINTQAVINEKESLLIGGYYHESKSKTVSGIPVLKDIPVIGFFFKQDQVVTKRAERLFLITPRVVTRDSYPAVEPRKGAADPPDQDSRARLSPLRLRDDWSEMGQAGGGRGRPERRDG